MSVVGVDLGGTKIAVAELSGRDLGGSAIEPTEHSGSDALIDQVARLVDRARSDGLQAVGVGVPSIVEFASGRVVSSVNVPLADVPLRDVLSRRIGVPVFVDNDATVAALAEAHDEHLRLTAQNLVMVTIGTGVGGGIVLGGRIYRGSTGGAGELGHTMVGTNLAGNVPPPDGKFPQVGSLEWVASGHALDRLAAECAVERPESVLGRRHAAGLAVLGADAVQAARDGDAPAAHIVELWAERIGLGIANVINTFDPEEVVIGGGGANAGDLMIDTAIRVAGEYVLPGLGRATRIRLARWGVRAGVLGAGLLAMHELQAASRGVAGARGSGAGAFEGAEVAR